MKITEQNEICPKCLELIIQIRQGKITGAVLSCHPLDEIADTEIRQYIKSRRMDG